MHAETASRVSIPTQTLTVKKMMSGLLSGLPVTSREFGATLGSEATAEEFTVALSRLCGVERQVIVRSKFQKGDLWDQFQSGDFRAERARWLAALRHRIPDEEKRDKYLQEFRHCAWVARAWPEEYRSDKYGWTWYVKREVSAGGVVSLRGAGGAPMMLRGTLHVMSDDGEYYECLTTAEKPCILRVSADMPVRDDRTVKP